MRMRSEIGFTLIELLVVVAIIGILAAIAVPNFLAARTRSLIGAAEEDLHAVTVALESYHTDHSTYPSYKSPYDGSPGKSGEFYETYVPINLTTPNAYLQTVPMDPFPERSVTDPEVTGQTPFLYFNRKETPMRFPHLV